MKGQWFGNFLTDAGIVGALSLDIEAHGAEMRGRAYLFPRDVDPLLRPILVGEVLPFVPGAASSDVLILINPLHPSNGALVSWGNFREVFPNISLSTVVQAKLTYEQFQMTASWHGNAGGAGTATLESSDPTLPSRLQAQRVTWQEFKDHIFGLNGRQYVFRGQRKPWRLRSKFHRSGRCDLTRYTAEDMTMLHRRLSAHTDHLFSRENSEENGALLHLAQHHGFPTPLIDWSYSPFVATFFAYREIRSSEARGASPDECVRIYQFDKKQWWDDVPQLLITAPVQPHFSLLEFLAVSNERLIPQQALSGLTNVDDVESYISHVEKGTGTSYLKAFDLQVSNRDTVMRELSLMGITAGSLFPGLDGACEELTERLFNT